MVSRRGWRALVLSLLVLGVFVVPVTLSNASPIVINANENAHTLLLSLPGPFNGCSYLDPGATPTSNAILDLVRPSAFVTGANGTLVGENGAIASAELTSLQPETVRYTIAAGQNWSDGVAFTGHDLVSWWQRARSLASVTSDGYRAIKSLTLSHNALTVTAVFSSAYADWDQLFRDVESIGPPMGCAIHSLLTKPSLGPYRVTSASSNRVVLNMNTNWPLDPNRFGRIVITDKQTLPSTRNAVYAGYSLAVGSAQVQTVSARPSLLSRIASSSNIEELTFAPNSYFTRNVAVRKALSWSISRQSLIDHRFGAVTLVPQVAASAIYSQGQSQYPGTTGVGPVGQQPTTTITNNGAANGLSDCSACAVDELVQSGHHRTASGWLNRAGKLLSVRLAVGPSALDRTVATLIKNYWMRLGVSTTVMHENSEIQASQAAATSDADVAVFARPTLTTPSYAARSWAGPAYANTYPSGVRSVALTTLFNQASTIFNPVTAAATWLKLDQIIMKDYWVRPLFTAPSLAVWTSTLVTVQNSFTVTGFVDQLPTWSIAPLAPTT
ncbi:MAG TPA: ABC transporter substrate-binding protein [Acidimicrobiales bacterium]|nr:ABC transporter substrate-binding protein [Acidimicrobiales bacterium]